MSSYLKDILKLGSSESSSQEDSTPDWVVASGVLEVEDEVATPAVQGVSERAFTLPNEILSQLQNKVVSHNKKCGRDASKLASSKSLLAVYRRGASTYNVVDRFDLDRHTWAMSRVDAFLGLLASGRPTNSLYTSDNDLLPPTHPKSPKRNTDLMSEAHEVVKSAITAAVSVKLQDPSDYATAEQAIFALAEYSGLGYEVIPSIRAVWQRALAAHEEPFERAFNLVADLYSSQDADLLPRVLEDVNG